MAAKFRVVRKKLGPTPLYFPQVKFLWRWWYYGGEYGDVSFLALKDAVAFIEGRTKPRKMVEGFDVVWEVEG